MVQLSGNRKNNKQILDIFVEADKDRISQVISNLLSNAINSMEAGTITVTAERSNRL
jgi:signal transduction histidine kinase